MQLQTKIEQTAKEYLLYKSLLEQKLKEVETKKESVAKKALELKDDVEALYGMYFDELAHLNYIQIDMNQMKIKLYHQIKTAEDIVEIPEDLKQLVEDYTPSFLFSVDGEVTNKPLYEKYRKEYIDENIYFLKLNKQ